MTLDQRQDTATDAPGPQDTSDAAVIEHSAPVSIVQQLGSFAAATVFADLPDDVVRESKRILLDSIGCAVAAAAAPSNTKARVAVDFATAMGGNDS